MATNEIAMLYHRPPGWEATSSPAADEVLAPGRTLPLDAPTKVANASRSVSCFLSTLPGEEIEVAMVECRSEGPASSVDWSPAGQSCAGADFLGYYLDDDVRAAGRRVATFGCTTDVSPLIDPTVTAKRIAAGEAVTLGGITCLSTGPAIACHNLDGNGMLTAVDEVSFFYGRQVPRG